MLKHVLIWMQSNKADQNAEKDFVNMKSQLMWILRGRKKGIYLDFGVMENYNVVEHKASLEYIMSTKRILQLGVMFRFRS